MGLDISYHSNIDLKNPCSDRDSADVYLYPNDMIFGQSDGIKGGEYLCEGIHDSFRAGSYSGYSSWRKTLARLIGWEVEDLWAHVATLVQRNDNLNGVLSESDEFSVDIPFIELLNFSDCEGFIGPKTSAKLHSDFLEWDEKAKAVDQGYFYEKYKDWTKAFEVASDGGCVVFC